MALKFIHLWITEEKSVSVDESMYREGMFLLDVFYRSGLQFLSPTGGDSLIFSDTDGFIGG